MASAFLQPKLFWDIWDLYDSISFRIALSFLWDPDLGLGAHLLVDQETAK